MKKFEIENHAPSFLPEDSQWKLIWAGEFVDDAFIVDFVRVFDRVK